LTNTKEIVVTGAAGVLPDDVSRDPRAGSWLVFVDLAAGADVQTWLKEVATPAVNDLVSTQGSVGTAASCTIGFGSSLFDKAKTVAQRPQGLSTALPTEVPPDAHDLVFYVFSVSDAVVAEFLRALNVGSSGARMTLERGYQRADKREVFGQADGLRNVAPADRAAVAFIGDDQPQEPAWSRGGSYMAYLKIKQNVAAWTALSVDQQDQVIGRRVDGSRLDLPTGSDTTAEPPFADAATPAACSHVRKAGPRGAQQEQVRIFRRGTPFIECTDGALIEGLQFVSYQASLDDFLTILQRWMLNPTFPTPTAGIDSLLDPAKGLTTFLKGGVYFAVPHDARFIGAGMFDTASGPVSGIIIHLVVQNATGAVDPMASLEGAIFQVAAADGAVLATLTTDAAGHAASPPLPTGVPLTVTQMTAPAGAQITPGPTPQLVTLERCEKALLTFTDTRTGTPGGYGA
jgi:deferrochelatase/peroxidase EfeB